MIKCNFKHMELILQMVISLYEFCFEKGQSKFNKEDTYCYTYIAHMTILTKLTKER